MKQPRDSGTRISRSAVVPFTCAQMYGLVADVESYPEFLPWCRSARVHSRDEREIEASLEVARGPIRKSFTTRNSMVPGERIDIRLVRGPFRFLEGRWRFERLGEQRSRVSLEMRFEVSGALLRRTLGPLFGQIANSLVDAFTRRAQRVHGS